MSRAAELDQWLERLEASELDTDRRLAAAGRALLAEIVKAPCTEYRDMALCKLTDAITLAAVAARQPKEEAPCSKPTTA